MRAAELGEALTRAETRADSRADDVDRDALVAELAAEILAAAGAGDKWRPDYDDLMARTARQRRWCEYVVRDARGAVFRTQDQPRTDGDGAESASPARADGRAGPHAGERADARAKTTSDAKPAALVGAGSGGEA